MRFYIAMKKLLRITAGIFLGNMLTIAVVLVISPYVQVQRKLVWKL
jgi:hypothetical protein